MVSLDGLYGLQPYLFFFLGLCVLFFKLPRNICAIVSIHAMHMHCRKIWSSTYI